jgi:hypothetical protein
MFGTPFRADDGQKCLARLLAFVPSACAPTVTPATLKQVLEQGTPCALPSLLPGRYPGAFLG